MSLDAKPVRAGAQARVSGPQINDRGRCIGGTGVERGLVAVGVHAGITHVAPGHLHAIQKSDESIVKARH